MKALGRFYKYQKIWVVSGKPKDLGISVNIKRSAACPLIPKDMGRFRKYRKRWGVLINIERSGAFLKIPKDLRVFVITERYGSFL